MRPVTRLETGPTQGHDSAKRKEEIRRDEERRERGPNRLGPEKPKPTPADGEPAPDTAGIVPGPWLPEE